MALEEVPSVHIDPSDAMLSLFRRTVMAAFGRDPVDGKITVSIDRYGFSVNRETIEAGPESGQRVAIDRWVTLTTDGELSQHQDAEPLSQRLAREIKSPDPEPTKFDLDVEAFRSMGYSEKDAYAMSIDALFSRPGIAQACSMFVKYLDETAAEAAHGLNDVDAFELADTIQSVRDNFGLRTT